MPLNFGKRLAHTDKAVRDKGFAILKMWLQKNPQLERLDYMKLWKGLYFGMWMSDKRPVQQELAVNMALLIKEIPPGKQALWLDTFWETMQEAWEKLDQHRINKYLLFARIVVAEAFQALRLRAWPREDLRAAAGTFTRATAASGSGPNIHSIGLLLQFTRIFWDELQPELDASKETPPEAIMELVGPFCDLAEQAYNDGLVRSIHEHMLRRAPPMLRPLVAARVSAAAERGGVPKRNQEALRETATLLGVAPQPPAAAAGDASASAAEAAADGTAGGKKKKKVVSRKRKAGAEAAGEVMSPLMLPKSAVSQKSGGPEAEPASAPKRSLTKQKRKRKFKEAKQGRIAKFRKTSRR